MRMDHLIQRFANFPNSFEIRLDKAMFGNTFDLKYAEKEFWAVSLIKEYSR